MDCGKSTLALQMDHNHAAAGRSGLIFTQHDRAGEAVVSSRLGLTAAALEMTERLDFWDVVVEHRMNGERVDYLICDEAQFYSPEQVGQLARLVDEMAVDVFAFGDHRGLPHPAVPRVAAADRAGRPGAGTSSRGAVLVRCTRHPQRADGGRGDGARGRAGRRGRHSTGTEIGYEVLCGRHHLHRMTRAVAHAAAMSPDVLPLDLRPVPPVPVARP